MKSNRQMTCVYRSASVRNAFVICLGVTLGYLTGGGKACATTWDLANDYSITNGNPHSQWAYGSINALPDTGTFASFTTPVNLPTGTFGLTGPIDAWYTNPVDPNITHNPSNVSTVTCCGPAVQWAPNQVNFSPAGAAYVDATWTAPGPNSYTVNAHFFNTQTADSHNVYVYLNGTQLFSGVTGNTVYDNTQGAFYGPVVLNLSGGDVLHFLANGGNNIAVSATIVPEPATCALFALGMVAVVRTARRRR